ncbi:hypothetical protein [Halobacillus kuroshimensis]|nr:hypothetical protein [Halobacillus kuroshimensis]
MKTMNANIDSEGNIINQITTNMEMSFLALPIEKVTEEADNAH